MKNLYAKLLLVQKELGAIKKGEDNPFFKSKYFDINALAEHVKPLLSEHGLVLIQPLGFLNSYTTLKTILVDVESGESLETETILPDGSDPQKMGSAITYFRRYAIQSLLFLQAEDDDANIASQPKYAQKPQQAQGHSSSVGDFEYKTGITATGKNTGKPWYMKKNKNDGSVQWLNETEYAIQANGGKLTPVTPAEAKAMQDQPDDLPW